MRELELVGLSEDGVSVVLRERESGETFAVRVDDRLRAAVVLDRVRLGQLEIALASRLRPKDIQARIRAGQEVSDVAAAAGLPVERVMRFAGPVLAERTHIAGQARRAVLRRTGGEPPRPLGEAVADRLDGRGVTDEPSWDAWRREDGSWTVRVGYHSGERERAGHFVFDPLSRVVVPADDEARWLAGETGPLHGPQPRTGVQQARGQAAGAGRHLDDGPQDRDVHKAEGRGLRLAPIESQDEAERPAGSPELFDRPYHRGEAAEQAQPLEPAVGERSVLEDSTPTASIPRVVEGFEPDERLEPDERPDLDEMGENETTAPEARDEPVPAQPVGAEGADEPAAELADEPTRKGKARRRRAAVPSWDDILFGSGRGPHGD